MDCFTKTLVFFFIPKFSNWRLFGCCVFETLGQIFASFQLVNLLSFTTYWITYFESEVRQFTNPLITVTSYLKTLNWWFRSLATHQIEFYLPVWGRLINQLVIVIQKNVKRILTVFKLWILTVLKLWIWTVFKLWIDINFCLPRSFIIADILASNFMTHFCWTFFFAEIFLCFPRNNSTSKFDDILLPKLLQFSLLEYRIKCQLVN